MKVFVYGTLRKDDYNHIFLENSEFIKYTKTKPEWIFYDLGGFPAAVEGGNISILGELYDVDEYTLGRLDVLESHPEFYVRRKILLEDDEEVFAYIMRSAYCEGCRLIESGDWKNKN